jgi:DNA invertase Pin-like site-specific DNA recombinase
MQIYGYLRVSGRGQLHGDGFTRQQLAIEKYCAGGGHELVEVFREKAVPGATDMVDRPAWRDMLALILANGVKTIVIERLDRLARDLMVQEHIIADCQKRGILLVSTAEPDLCSSDPTRILMRQILGAVAAYDKAMIVLKLRGARERQRASGGRCEGAKPYGELAGEQAILERMRALREAGATLLAIAAGLNDAGVKPRSGTAWHAKTVARILDRPAAAPILLTPPVWRL